MKKYIAISLLATMVLSGAQTFAATYPETDEAIQNAKVKIGVDLSGGIIVDPGGDGVDPGLPIEPTDPTNPPDINDNDGLLKINYVSDFLFSNNANDGSDKGKVIYDGKELTLYAADDSFFDRKPFLNVEDRRVDGDSNDDGTAGEYRVVATMDSKGYIHDTSSVALTGATTEIKTQYHTFDENEGIVTSTYQLDPGKEIEVISSSKGLGSNSISFDEVKLTIPSNLSLVEGDYVAKIHWNVMGNTP